MATTRRVPDRSRPHDLRVLSSRDLHVTGCHPLGRPRAAGDSRVAHRGAVLDRPGLARRAQGRRFHETHRCRRDIIRSLPRDALENAPLPPQPEAMFHASGLFVSKNSKITYTQLTDVQIRNFKEIQPFDYAQGRFLKKGYVFI